MHNTNPDKKILGYALIVVAYEPCSSTNADSLVQACFFTDLAPTSCSHALDIGLNCSNCSMFLCDDGECVDSVPCDGKTLCKDKSDKDEVITCSKSQTGTCLHWFNI